MINVIGLGYIGLPTALILAKNNQDIVGTDINIEVIEKLNSGIISFKEKGLEELFNNAIKKNIKFSTSYQKANIYIVAVPTPYNPKTKKIEVKYLLSALKNILRVFEKGAIVIIESTISPGTIDNYIRPEISKEGFIIGEDIHLAHAPERIIPGNMIFELENNSRTIGSDDGLIGTKVKSIYSSFCKSEIHLTDIKTAEMTKVVENTFRDINIAFANELAKICRSDNMDVYEIIKIANKHPRVNILQPGPGVGGHCIPVDPWFLVGDYPKNSKLILSARLVNSSMPKFVLKRLKDIMRNNNIKDYSRVGIYGLSYKENVDDIRESPSIQFINIMNKEQAAQVKIYDPYISLKFYENQYLDFSQFLENIDLVIVFNSHDHIKDNINLLKDKIVFDTKNNLSTMKTYKL